MKHRKLLSAALALALALSFCAPAFAAEEEILTQQIWHKSVQNIQIVKYAK